MKERMKDIVEAAEAGSSSIGEWMLNREVIRSGRSEEAVRLQMKERLQVMKQAVQKGTANTCESESGLSGGDASRMNDYVQQGTPLSGTLISDAMLFAMAVSESNARMEVIVATPTAGSAGIQSRIPCDEVIDTVHRIGSSMPSALKETSKGGLAVTPAGQKASAAMAARPCSF
nr:L-serine ammonia-lyase, iron-sulfur-dependent, subunit alpha [Sinobaca sp. H24]